MVSSAFSEVEHSMQILTFGQRIIGTTPKLASAEKSPSTTADVEACMHVLCKKLEVQHKASYMRASKGMPAARARQRSC